MSGFAAIFNLDGRPVDRDLLSRMIHAVPYRGPDGIHAWADGSVGLAHAMMCTTPESLHETQPIRDDTAGLVLTMDGRVDNREELAALLNSKGYRLRDDTDAELVIRAYECWGEESPAKIIGDFAYVIWDARRRRLFCARDVLGKKSFYYFCDGRTFLAGSELHQLLRSHGVSRAPNEGMVAEYLSADLRNREETFYRSISRLAPACSMSVAPGKSTPRRYYDLCSAPEVRFANDQEYADRFHEIFTEAVRCRMRCTGTLGATLSGGLDSSSVVAMVQRLRGKELAIENPFETFSMHFDHKDSDERFYIEEVVRHCALTAHGVAPSIADESSYLDQVRRYRDLPDYPSGMMEVPAMAAERERGCRVVLTGSGGDDWFTGSTFYYADLLREFKFAELLRAISTSSHIVALDIDQTVASAIREVAWNGLYPLARQRLPRSARRWLRSALGYERIPAWIEESLVKRTCLRDRLQPVTVENSPHSFVQRELLDGSMSAWMANGNEHGDRIGARYGLEFRGPFLDRRMMEFGYGIPELQRCRNGQIKYVMRNAMRTLLPESVRIRRTKGDFAHVFADSLRTLVTSRCSEFSIVNSLGWVDADIARQAMLNTLELYRDSNVNYMRNLWPIWMTLATEMWASEMFGSSTHAADSTTRANVDLQTDCIDPQH